MNGFDENINNSLLIIEKEFNHLNSFNIENNIENRIELYKKTSKSSEIINNNIYKITNIVKDIRETKLEETKTLAINFLTENKSNKKLSEINSCIEKDKNIFKKYKENKEELYEELSLNLELFLEIIKKSNKKNNYQIKIEEIKKYRIFIHDVINKLNLVSINLINKVLLKELEKKEIIKEEIFFKKMFEDSKESIDLLKNDLLSFKNNLIISDEDYQKNLKEIEDNFYIILPKLFDQKITFRDAKMETLLTIINDEKYKKYLKFKYNLDDEKDLMDFLNKSFL